MSSASYAQRVAWPHRAIYCVVSETELQWAEPVASARLAASILRRISWAAYQHGAESTAPLLKAAGVAMAA